MTLNNDYLFYHFCHDISHTQFYMGGIFENRIGASVPLTKYKFESLICPSEVDMCISSQLYKISMFDNPLRSDLFLFAHNILELMGNFLLLYTSDHVEYSYRDIRLTQNQF